MTKKIYIIAGATASGKTDFAIQLAKAKGGEIINIDALQVYKDLQILSARPTEAEQAGIPHHLYGYMDAHSTISMHQWLNDAVEIIDSIETPIFVGGTGLYVHTLMHGYNDIPPIDEAIRDKVRDMPIEEVKAQVLECTSIDPQRLRRALEVQLSTGKTLSYFLEQPKIQKITADFTPIVINPKRKVLYDRCDKRFDIMLENGAIDEVKHLLSIKATGGVVKAIGVNEILMHLLGELTYEEMVDKSKQLTRNYAKRQMTWFNNQMRTALQIPDTSDFDINDIA